MSLAEGKSLITGGSAKGLALVAVCGAVLLSGCGSGSGQAHRGLVAIGAGLEGPEGLKAAVYARGLALASALTFDGQGRLWVATSGASTHGTDGVYLVPRAGARPGASRASPWVAANERGDGTVRDRHGRGER